MQRSASALHVFGRVDHPVRDTQFVQHDVYRIAVPLVRRREPHVGSDLRRVGQVNGVAFRHVEADLPRAAGDLRMGDRLAQAGRAVLLIRAVPRRRDDERIGVSDSGAPEEKEKDGRAQDGQRQKRGQKPSGFPKDPSAPGHPACVQAGTCVRDGGDELVGVPEPPVRRGAAGFHIERQDDPDLLKRDLLRNGREKHRVHPGPGAVDDFADGVQVAGARLVGCRIAGHFRGHEAGGPKGRVDRAVQRVGQQAVVGQLRFLVEKDDVVRLDVAMREPGVVKVPDGRQHLVCQTQDLFRPEPTVPDDAVRERVRLVVRPLRQIVRRRHDAPDASAGELPDFQNGDQSGDMRGYGAAFFDSGELAVVVRLLDHLQDFFLLDVLVHEVQIPVAAPDEGRNDRHPFQEIALLEIKRSGEAHNGRSRLKSGFSMRMSETIFLSVFRQREQYTSMVARLIPRYRATSFCGRSWSTTISKIA